MRQGDVVCVGVSVYDARKGCYEDLDSVEDIVVRIYTNLRKVAGCVKMDMDRKSKHVYCAFLSTMGMDCGVLFCEFYTVTGRNKGLVYRKEIGFLKERGKHGCVGL